MLKFIKKSVLFVLTASVLMAASNDTKTLNIELTKPRVDFIENIGFAMTKNITTQDIQLSMDILKPVSEKPLPAVVYVTGGGFLTAPKSRYLQQRLAIAEAGYVVASVEYRPVPDGIFPGPIEDVKTAIRFIKENAATFGVDPDRVAIMGDSAGGYLAAMVGTTNKMREFDKGQYLDQNSDVIAAIDIYGLSDLTKISEGYPDFIQDWHKSAAAPEALFVNGTALFSGGPGGSIESNMEKTNAANPITYISENTPPFLLMHGNHDSLVSPKQTELLHDALTEKGISSTRYLVNGADHADVYWNQPEVLDIIINFLNPE